MRYIDISVSLSNKTIPWEGDRSFERKLIARTKPGDPKSCNLSRIGMSAHLGTHVDAPLHFVHGGDDVASLPLDTLIGPARVIDVRGMGLSIDADILRGKNVGPKERVLIKSDNEGLYDRGEFVREFAHLTDAAALFLREMATKLVGIDYLSVDRYSDPQGGLHLGAHHNLLDPREDGTPPVIILETIDLRGAVEGDYELVCLPAKIEGSDGAPARAVLIER